MNGQPIELEFGPRRRRVDPVSLTLLVAGGVVAALAMLRVADALALQVEVRDDLARLERGAQPRAAGPAAARASDVGAAAQWQAGRRVAGALQSPWSDLLDVIEVRPRADVALLAVEPSATKRLVRITAEARNAQAMLDHVAMLQGDARLSDVVLVSHQQQLQAAGAPWRYQIQAAW